MNILAGVINDILVHGNLSLVKIALPDVFLTSIVIETPDTVDYLKIGAQVRVMFKETEVIIGKNGGDSISLQNQIPVNIVAIKKGVLLSQLTLEHGNDTLYSVITTNAVKQLDLNPGDKVLAMIKTNEIMLSE